MSTRQPNSIDDLIELAKEHLRDFPDSPEPIKLHPQVVLAILNVDWNVEDEDNGGLQIGF